MAFEHSNLQIHTADIPKSQVSAPRRIRLKTRLSFQERLLRNCFLASAVLLGILALGNVQQPWAIKASQSVEQALTMKINLDESLGQLSFVKKLMPESALVFFNLSGDHEFAQPVQGELTHPYNETQPWLMFACAAETDVNAPADGVIAAISPLSDGRYGVLIDHGEGLESVLASLKSVSVQTGDEILRGDKIGASADNLYFELRQNETPADPTERMGL